MTNRKAGFALTGAFMLASAWAMAAAFVPGQPVAAQTAAATAQPTAIGPTNGVQGTLFACPDAFAVQFTGTLVTGWDVYYQVFTGAGATGAAIGGVRQVAAAGAFTFGERVALPAGTTLGAGSAISARVWVGREGNASSIDFEFTLNDVQDGCGSAAPTGPATSVDTGGGASTGTTTTASVNLAAPNGVTLNPNLRPEPTVVVGARPSENFRSETPGLIFAECNEDPLALPGLVYDSDNVVVYWSWFTRTLAQMEEHLATAQYSVRLNSAPFPNVQISEPERRGGVYYTFFSAQVGNLRPGAYEIEYRVTWTEAVNDGFDDYGPGTANPIDSGNCNFRVTLNPSGTSIAHTDMYFPTLFPVHDIINDD
jgi:hypothetical protein